MQDQHAGDDNLQLLQSSVSTEMEKSINFMKETGIVYKIGLI